MGSSSNAAAPGERRALNADRRRRDRGGRRRTDWPEDAGLTACPSCGHDILQSRGSNDAGTYLWTCGGCRRDFETSRASRVLL
jgi:ribosomal protein L32